MSDSPDPKLAAEIDAAVDRAKRIQAAMDNESVTAVINMRVPQCSCGQVSAAVYRERLRRNARGIALVMQRTAARLATRD